MSLAAIEIETELKKCTKCGLAQSLDCFGVDKQKKDGLRPSCKSCGKKFYNENADKLRAKTKEYYWKNPEKSKANTRQFRESNLEKVKTYMTVYRKEKKEEIKQASKAWRAANVEKVRASKRESYHRNKDQILTRLSEKRKQPKQGLHHRISQGILKSLKQKKSGLSWESIVGYTAEMLMRHLEKQFLPGMSWANFGDWHVDHKVPVAAFNFAGPYDIDFKRCWDLKNLRPLWAKDNISKGKKLMHPFQPSLALRAKT